MHKLKEIKEISVSNTTNNVIFSCTNASCSLYMSSTDRYLTITRHDENNTYYNTFPWSNVGNLFVVVPN